MKWHGVAVAAASATILAVGTASAAEPTVEERALALTLFKRGREAIDIGDLATACRCFEESQRLDPGGGTLLNLAVCHDQQGRTASAWTEYADALALARRDGRADRIELAQKNRTLLESRLVRLTIIVPRREDRLRIVRDGVDIPKEAWDVGVPVDPGEHVVEAWVGTKRVFEQRVTVASGDVTTTVAADEAPEASRETTPVRERPTRTRAIAGWSFVGGGLAIAGVGTFFGLRALDEKSASDDACSGGRCSVASVEANDRAKTAADIATVSVGAAVVAVGLGVYFLLTRGDGS